MLENKLLGPMINTQTGKEFNLAEFFNDMIDTLIQTLDRGDSQNHESVIGDPVFAPKFLPAQGALESLGVDAAWDHRQV